VRSPGDCWDCDNKENNIMMHVVLGDGEMTRKELTETLADLWKADQEADASFWFLIQGKSEPTATDRAMVAWLEKNETYYEIITDDADSVDEVYAQPQETHVAKQMGRKIVNLLKGKPEEGEEAELLALFVSNEPEAEEDRWLNSVVQEVFDAGFKVRAFNDGLVEIDLAEGPEEPEPEQTAKVTPIKKAVAKKGGAAPRRDTPVSDEDETEASSASKTYTRDELEEMELPQIKEIAAAKGLEFPSRTRSSTYIDAILGEDRPAAEVEAPAAASNGEVTSGLNIGALADALIEAVIRRLEAAFSE